MNKTMEYVALELPVTAFDQRETDVSAQSTGTRVVLNRVREPTKSIDLMEYAANLAWTAKAGRRARAEDKRARAYQECGYIADRERLFGSTANAPGTGN